MIKEPLVSIPQQFTPFSSKRSSTPTCIVGNAIPKCGTYLLDAIIHSLGSWERINIHVLSRHWDRVVTGEATTCTPSYALRKLRNGQSIAAHLPYLRETEKVIDHKTNNRHIKHLFMYRDPRDSWTSYMRFFTYAKLNEGSDLQKNLQLNFNNDSDRLEHIIKYHYRYYTLRYLPWLESNNTHAIHTTRAAVPTGGNQHRP